MLSIGRIPGRLRSGPLTLISRRCYSSEATGYVSSILSSHAYAYYFRHFLKAFLMPFASIHFLKTLLSCIHRMTPGKESSYGVVLFQDDKTNVFHDSRDELMDFQNSGVFCNLHMTAHSNLPDNKRRDLLNNRLRP